MMLLNFVLTVLVTVSVNALTADGFDHVVMIGDVHGSYSGLTDLLHASGATSSPDSCLWVPQEKPLLLVQTGDIVDRGPGAMEAFDCLQYLQRNAADNNAKVVRLVGNHELWWLENILGHRNPDTDTPEVILKVISALIDDILNGDVVGAYYYEHAPASPEGGKQLPVLFTHGGISPEYYGFLEKKSAEFKAWRKSGGNVAEFLADHITAGLRDAVAHTCTLINYRNPNSQVPKCTMKGELFAAGKERGGGPIGGPFWSDFSVMERSAASGFYDKAIPGVMQVVGHSMAHCYAYKHERTGTHPKSTDNQCGKGLIRHATSPSGDVNGICIDAGMYLGGRAYLTLESAGEYGAVTFAAHERGFADSPRGEGQWGSRTVSTHAVSRGGSSAKSNEL